MTSSRIRESILVSIAFAVGAGSLLVAGSALAALEEPALFRIEQRWHGFPSPAITPGGAGMYQGYVFPYYYGPTPAGGGLDLPKTAYVEPNNPTGGAFTLPQGFLTYSSTGSLTPKTAWPGYTTVWDYHAYNGPGQFQANNGGTTPIRLVFPTTGGDVSATMTNNPTPNYGLGNPINATTTFGGRYDLSRGGSLHVTPGGNRFGGTWRMFVTDSHWDQFIFFYSPVLYTGLGTYHCFDEGVYGCTPGNFESNIGDTTVAYKGIWWLLTELGKAKATTATETFGTTPTMSTPTPTYYGNGTLSGGPASYLRRSQHYLNLIHPWTTGKATAVVAAGNQGTGTITPYATGYDVTHTGSGITLTILKRNYNQVFNKTLTTLVTSTTTPYTQTLTGITRIVSMVRPRLTWTMAVPLDPSEDPIENIWTPVRMRNLKVYFLPEPAGMLMLGVGIASLLGLSRMRRR